MNLVSKIIGVFLVIAIGAWLINHFLFTTASTEQSHWEYYFDLYDIETIRHPSIESEYPSWAVPDETQSITNLQYWVDTLPHEQDKRWDAYLVYPRHGMTIPVVVPSEYDANKIYNGESFNHYPYLDSGGLFYRWTSPDNGFGNMVVAAHSSYTMDAPWRFKTVFQVLPISKKWDSVFVYLRNAQGTFDLYTYIITDSFRTQITDISVLAQPSDFKQLTTYGCYIIGDNSERWVNQAVLDGIQSGYKLENINSQEKITTSTTTSTITTSHDYLTQNDPLPVKAQDILWNQEHGSAPLDVISNAADTTSNQAEIQYLDSIISKIPLELIPQVEELVWLIKSRLVKEPHLHERVQTRLHKKIHVLLENSDPSMEKILWIYQLIDYLLDRE